MTKLNKVKIVFFDIDGYSKYKEQNIYTSSRCEY